MSGKCIQPEDKGSWEWFLWRTRVKYRKGDPLTREEARAFWEAGRFLDGAEREARLHSMLEGLLAERRWPRVYRFVQAVCHGSASSWGVIRGRLEGHKSRDAELCEHYALAWNPEAVHHLKGGPWCGSHPLLWQAMRISECRAWHLLPEGDRLDPALIAKGLISVGVGLSDVIEGEGWERLGRDLGACKRIAWERPWALELLERASSVECLVAERRGKGKEKAGVLDFLRERFPVFCDRGAMEAFVAGCKDLGGVAREVLESWERGKDPEDWGSVSRVVKRSPKHAMDVPEWVAANAKFLSGHPETWKFLPTAGYPEVEEEIVRCWHEADPSRELEINLVPGWWKFGAEAVRMYPDLWVRRKEELGEDLELTVEVLPRMPMMKNEEGRARVLDVMPIKLLREERVLELLLNQGNVEGIWALLDAWPGPKSEIMWTLMRACYSSRVVPVPLLKRAALGELAERSLAWICVRFPMKLFSGRVPEEKRSRDVVVAACRVWPGCVREWWKEDFSGDRMLLMRCLSANRGCWAHLSSEQLQLALGGNLVGVATTMGRGVYLMARELAMLPRRKEVALRRKASGKQEEGGKEEGGKEQRGGTVCLLSRELVMMVVRSYLSLVAGSLEGADHGFEGRFWE